MYIYTQAGQTEPMRCARLENGAFPSIPHVHRDMELVFVQKNGLIVTVDSLTCAVSPGQCLLILPHQIHFYGEEMCACGIVLNFPGEMVSSFNTIVASSVAENPVFSPDQVSKILLDRFLINGSFQDECDQKCLLYALCSCFLQSVRLIPRTLPERSPAYHAIHYVAEHYRENISLKDIARALGYDYHYLSRTFHQTTHTGFRDFLNFHRIEYARGLLRNTDMNIADIAEACGFQTLRSFHRVFQDIMGVSPTRFRHTPRI